MEWIEVITGFIQNLGFPIACVVAMFYMWNKEREEHAKESDKWVEAINNNTVVMERLLRKMGETALDDIIKGGDTK